MVETEKGRAGWQSSWREFSDFLSDSLKNGKSASDLADVIAGAQIEWEGILKAKKFSEYYNGITVTLPAQELRLPSGGAAEFTSVVIPIAEGSLEEWNCVEVGTPIVFSASFNGPGCPFPAFRLQQLEDNKSPVVWISLQDARVIKKPSS